MKNLYIIAGPNGAGKTTASYTILPEIFNCDEFVNADEIARGLSPFNPDEVAIQSGKMMVRRIKELLHEGKSFAIETTLATKSHVSLIEQARSNGYTITLLFLFLDSIELAIERVGIRVKEGGHDIPKDVIARRYERGLNHLFNRYLPIVDEWSMVNNSKEGFSTIARGLIDGTLIEVDKNVWRQLKTKYYDK
ncbi:zeta toxin family protein [Muricauda sp. SCSIO 64092]|uniref:zeta toxin family protein n=1 Tax=Allomuricauda sp. SCSIO 64092 TaxID=2908842 RepID=UPI001FF4FC0A|nr:zeta toxin family protein [Muricauda sp. SCSIO 64092]UOY04987.1 zeta toxin family protein [Muricauda sp. SCSIO 64092]